jgi:hypothetical protein
VGLQCGATCLLRTHYKTSPPPSPTCFCCCCLESSQVFSLCGGLLCCCILLQLAQLLGLRLLSHTHGAVVWVCGGGGGGGRRAFLRERTWVCGGKSAMKKIRGDTATADPPIPSHCPPPAPSPSYCQQYPTHTPAAPPLHPPLTPPPTGACGDRPAPCGATASPWLVPRRCHRPPARPAPAARAGRQSLAPAGRDAAGARTRHLRLTQTRRLRRRQQQPQHQDQVRSTTSWQQHGAVATEGHTHRQPPAAGGARLSRVVPRLGATGGAY